MRIAKRLFILLVTLCLVCVVTLVHAVGNEYVDKPCTNINICFRNIPWYIDYSTFVPRAENEGYINDLGMREDFDEGWQSIPHWNIMKNYSNWEKQCGGAIKYFLDVPKTAGYDVKYAVFYFMWNVEKGLLKNFEDENYRNENEILFYMVSQTLIAEDANLCYEDIVSKLIQKYGNNYYSSANKDYCYAYWIDEDYAAVGVRKDANGVEVYHSAPNSEIRLSEVKNAVKQYRLNRQIENSKDDMSGL